MTINLKKTVRGAVLIDGGEDYTELDGRRPNINDHRLIPAIK
jgi:hypothetical protein